MDKRTVGILGGGQLGRMLVEAAHRLNIKTVILDAPSSPAKQINALSSHVDGSFSNADDIRKLAQQCDILTTEIEHVDVAVLEEIQKSGKDVHPAPATIRVIQDKYVQKEFFQKRDVATAESIAITDGVSVEQAGERLGYPFMLKSRTLAYDGRGNFVVKTKEDVPAAKEALKNRPLYAEKWASFKMELAVMVVKEISGRCLSYPTVETVHENNICKLVYAPARSVSSTIREAARKLAESAVVDLPGAGIFGVEMFLLDDDTLLINEIAPRPHNSGHYTIETHATSQYEAHIRAILGLPLPDSIVLFRTRNTHAIMLNILGGPQPNSHEETCELSLNTPGATLHLYGKADARPGRKMGHVTVVADSMFDAEAYVSPMVAAADYNGTFNFIPSKSSPKIAVIMGSDSDLPVMRKAVDMLAKFNIGITPQIMSAHRTAERMFKFATDAEAAGIRVIIAGAGGAAHLPGMVASETTLPVIGVPIKSRALEGMDSLLSIVQMPPGIPVATMGIDKAENAALFALKILGVADEGVREKVREYSENLKNEVVAKDNKLQELGMDAYMAQMGKDAYMAQMGK